MRDFNYWHSEVFKAVLIGILPFLVGCAIFHVGPRVYVQEIDDHPIKSINGPKTNPKDIIVFKPNEKINRPYAELAYVIYSDLASLSKPEIVLGVLKKKASEIGANAIILEEGTHENQSWLVSPGIFGTDDILKERVKAVIVDLPKQ